MRIDETIYLVYIVTNIHQTVLYIGVNNNLERRLIEHYEDRIKKKHFAGKYNCYLLVYHEAHKYVNDAIAREKELKGSTRAKKNELIKTFNPARRFLNSDILEKWSP